MSSTTTDVPGITVDVDHSINSDQDRPWIYGLHPILWTIMSLLLTPIILVVPLAHAAFRDVDFERRASARVGRRLLLWAATALGAAALVGIASQDAAAVVLVTLTATGIYRVRRQTRRGLIA